MANTTKPHSIRRLGLIIILLFLLHLVQRDFIEVDFLLTRNFKKVSKLLLYIHRKSTYDLLTHLFSYKDHEIKSCPLPFLQIVSSQNLILKTNQPKILIFNGTLLFQRYLAIGDFDAAQGCRVLQSLFCRDSRSIKSGSIFNIIQITP